MGALWQQELASQRTWAQHGPGCYREEQCIHGEAPGDWCREGTGPEGQLGNRARSGQEPISRARCPSLVPAFIRCSESCATMALSQLFSPPTDFPTKLLFCLLQFPQHHLRNPSVSAQPLVLRLALCCQHSRNSGELQRAAAAWGRAVGHGCLTGCNEAAGAAFSPVASEEGRGGLIPLPCSLPCQGCRSRVRAQPWLPTGSLAPTPLLPSPDT